MVIYLQLLDFSLKFSKKYVALTDKNVTEINQDI